MSKIVILDPDGTGLFGACLGKFVFVSNAVVSLGSNFVFDIEPMPIVFRTAAETLTSKRHIDRLVVSVLIQ